MTFSFRPLALSLVLACGALSGLTATSYAQSRGADDQDSEPSSKGADEWADKDLRLDRLKADGPCPYVKVLYDAARFHEFKNNKESLSQAMWTGEIQGISSDCAYHGDEPIKVQMKIGFSLGRGQMAEGQTKDYHYWVAVTERDNVVIEKQEFVIPVTFAPGQERVDVNTVIENIVIPRAALTVSGSNFEILVGFDVTPQMADFNRQGKHFRYATPAVK